MSIRSSFLRTASVIVFVLIALPSAGWMAKPAAAQSPQPSKKATALVVGTNVNTTRRAGNQQENAIAINPLNPQQVVVLANDESLDYGLIESYSADGGATWTTQFVGTTTYGCCDPSLSWDQNGNLFLSWIDFVNPLPPVNDFTTVAEMLYSTDGGRTLHSLGPVSDVQPPSLRSPRTLPNARSPRATLPADQPTTVAGVGSVWITSANTTDGFVYARGAPVTGVGQVGAFQTQEQLPNSFNGNFGDIAIGPAGQVMVAYQANLSGAGPDKIYVNVDSDGLGAGGFGPAIFVTDTNVGGERLIPAQANNYGIDAEAGLAWDRSGGPHNGRVYMVYTDAPDTMTNDTDTFLRYSDNNGANWSARVKINDDSGTNSQFLPRIALDQTSGGIAISWYDSRNDLGVSGPGNTNATANDDAQLYATYSTDGGSTFAANFKVSGGTSNSNNSEPPGPCCRPLGYGDYVGLAFESGNIYPAWADNSNSTGDNPNGVQDKVDVYTARVSLFSADLSVIKSAPATATLGATLPYTITVTNNGPDAAPNVTLTDTLPVSTTWLVLAQTSGPTLACTTPAVGGTGTLSCALGSLASGASASLAMSVTVSANIPGSTVISNTARVTSDAADANPNNNVSTATTVVAGTKVYLPFVPKGLIGQ